MAVPAIDESWRQDPILVGDAAPPVGMNLQRCVPPTLGVIVHEPMYSRKVGVVRARTPHPENLNGLQRVAGAPARPIASHGLVGAELAGPEFVVGAPAKPASSRGPDSARARVHGAGLAGSAALRGAIGAAVVSLRRKLSGKSSSQNFSEMEEAWPVAPASPPRARFSFRARSYVEARAQQDHLRLRAGTA
ncbi:unnamed protein product [Prorocentrum cordatum]|uniref:Uncharacterized protein n=1 Tax=Prorocentrum cordatum TaxID=2364126 RepID=A0ABN9USQ3_9DINO|nr:unnamed protein product [Polarella glacialis]